ncbi:MAG: aldolase catalytic domain-containing protein [Planctomycetota bacterium]|jgi:4-hydroxy 2-oxovalerate aldolase
MFRPEIKVVDCTIRDGGLANDSNFALKTVQAVYQAICASGVDYVELGYRNSKDMFPPAEFGPWRFCDEDMLRKVTEGVDSNGTKIAIMQDAHKAVAEDVLPADESVVDMIRVATYVKDVDKAIHLARNAHDKGYECTINIMAISIEGSQFLDEALQQIEEETHALAVYVVDSFGALYSEEIDYYVEKFQTYLKTKEVGVHCHNNQQLAFANTIEGIIKDANFVDGTLYGLGRASGNCPLELLMGFLKNPKFNILPILKVISETILPLRKDIEWGYHIPYMLTGILNQHPLAAMKWMKTDRKDEFVDLYNELIEDPE